MNERQVPEEGYDRVLAKFTGWTCLALVALIVPGCIAGSVFAAIHEQWLGFLGLPGVASVCWVLLNTVMRCARVPAAPKAKKAGHTLPNGANNRPTQKRLDRKN